MIFLQQNEKKLLREAVLHKIKNLTLEEKKAIENQLYHHLFNCFLWKEANVIGITSSTSIEWNTEPIIERAWKENKIVALPKTIPQEAKLDYYQIKSFSDLKVGYGKILEPVASNHNYIPKEEIELLVVPGIVFDSYGYRIGFGGGYYDRFLVNFPNSTLSLVSRLQLFEKLPVEEHDIHVQFLITEDGLRRVSEV